MDSLLRTLLAVFQRSSVKGSAKEPVSRREFVATLKRDASAQRSLQQSVFQVAVMEGLIPRKAQRESERCVGALCDMVRAGAGSLTYRELEMAVRQICKPPGLPAADEDPVYRKIVEGMADNY